MNTKTGTMTSVLLIAATTAALLRAGLAGAADVTLASAADQTFAWTNKTAALVDVTITATDTGGAITNGVDMTLRVPSAWQCRFDTSASVTLGGAASGKIGAAGYAEGGRWLTLPVTNDFANGDALTISGLKLLDPALCRAGSERLELDYNGDGVTNIVDQRTLTVEVVWPGGSYDGWNRTLAAGYETLGVDVTVTLSSGTSQEFDWTAASAALAMLTITATEPAGTITNGGALRVMLPSGWTCRFDTGASLTYGGGASGKVGVATYPDGNRTLSIPVTADFANDDTLTITGMKLVDLRLQRPGTGLLGLDFTSSPTAETFDDHTVAVRALWDGGAYDGWDRTLAAGYESVEPPKGTMISIR